MTGSTGKGVVATVPVRAAAPYDVTIGRGLADAVTAAIGTASAVAVVCPEALRPLVAGPLAWLQDGAAAHSVVWVPNGEDAKTVDTLAQCWDAFSNAGLDRQSVVVGLGGGAVTDLAGFAAASYMRGIRLVQMPTTVLGMVDAAVGGKTGINTPAGKNMVGAFYEPSAVIADLDLLATLPTDELRAGLGEIIKCGFIRDPEILRIVEADPAGALDPRSDKLAELIRRGIAVKADVVSRDLKEAGDREFLNYGHTFGHAIEKRENFRWRHGEAVSVGMVFAAELARCAGTIDDELVERHRRILTSVGLPTSYSAGAYPELRQYMRADKKTRGGMLRFVVLKGLGQLTRLEGPSEEWLERAYRALAHERSSASDSATST